MISQKSVWLAWPPPLLRTAVRLSSGRTVEAREHVLDRPVHPLGPLERGVEVRDVRRVVLVVVDLHRLRVDVRLEGIERIREVGHGVRHGGLLRSSSVRPKDMLLPRPVPSHRGASCRRPTRSPPARSTRGSCSCPASRGRPSRRTTGSTRATWRSGTRSSAPSAASISARRTRCTRTCARSRST